ncbi:MAG: CPBP family intramembrane metalloprotease [Proteobacteria bacterium]|nr:CPBP family intramembrane metalloprotease [Pseudomonadota bacterium]
MDTKKIKPLTLALCTGFICASDYLLRMAFEQMHLPSYAGLGLIRLIQITAVIALVFGCEKTLHGIGLAKDHTLKGFQKGLLWSFLFGLTASAGFLVLKLSGINPFRLVRTWLPGNTMDRVFFFIAGGLIAPVAEELFFRGLVFGFLRQWGFLVALLLSTGIFVMIHPLSSGIPVPQIVGGLLFATCYEIEKSLWAPIVIHATGNMALFTLSLL